MIQEKQTTTFSGWVALALLIPTALLCAAGFIYGITLADERGAGFGPFALIIASLLAEAVTVVCLTGLFTVNPNESKVLQLFGKYVGTVRAAGFHWANPFYKKSLLSLRIRNFETGKSKVNDHDGNPIEIAAVVVWKVVDTAEASFEVDNYHNFVEVQSESALRNLATQHPYDSDDDKVQSLRGHTAEVAAQLKVEIQDRLSKAGMEVIEARISYLAYAPEIAVPMLQRQQAGAIIAARQKIVEGAVGMVEMALERLSKHKVVDLDEERKAAMVSNLLVVLCGERATQPVVNTGTLYK
jgi:regulator of protease activity HflC (stomatin/prohibitin superfamily)